MVFLPTENLASLGILVTRLFENFDGLLFDLDGVVYKGGQAIHAAVESISEIQKTKTIGYITNNASRKPEAIAEQLRGYGLKLQDNQVVGAAAAAAQLLSERIAPASKVLVVGGEGLRYEVEKLGFQIVQRASDQPAAVIQGFSPQVGWKDLAEASFAIQRGAIWIASNQDWTIPVEGGIAPGNGTLVSAVHTAVGKLPEFAGKPAPKIFETALSQLGITNPLFVGDRLDTDSKGARGFGIKSAIVLTGVSTRKDLLAAKPEERPDYILADLADLLRPYPELKQTKYGYRLGQTQVERLETKVRVVSGDPRSLEALRVACEVIWSSPIPIYGLDVEPDLYQE